MFVQSQQKEVLVFGSNQGHEIEFFFRTAVRPQHVRTTVPTDDWSPFSDRRYEKIDAIRLP